MSKIEIRHRWTNAILYTCDVADDDPNPVRSAVVQANLDGASLRGAILDGASLDGANLVNASLRGASLDGASLRGASLRGASLRGASLRGASLVNANLDGASLVNASLDGASLVNAILDGANLDGASLVNANLDGASLVNASLRGASLVNASLRGASLRGAILDGASLVNANLQAIRDDFRSVLDAAPAEVAGLLAALTTGQVDGSTYQGVCACLVGTIANVRGCGYESLVGLAPNSGRPAERWFLAIRPGHTPETSQPCAITVDWIREWQAERGEGDLIADA